jgi:hypothetical protein
VSGEDTKSKDVKEADAEGPAACARPTAKEEAERLAKASRASSDSPPTATSAAVNTKTGRVYTGQSGAPRPQLSEIHPDLRSRMPAESLEQWKVENCAEFKAVNNALKDGASVEALELHTVRTKTLEAMPRCANCRLTTAGTNVTSD